MKRAHAMPFGAQALEGGRTRFRLWAPRARSVDLVLVDRGEALAMPEAGDGWRELTTPAPPGTRYRYRIDGELEVPDPASRYNPDDVHGPSVVVDPKSFDWPDTEWRGRPWSEAAIYELHVGTFSPDGTFAGVERRLDYLADLGITAIELMPLADFPGHRNWGYDGVLQYAPDAAYGTPDDLKRLVVGAHARGLMMLLDVVYNHFGPEGNYLHAYAPQFFTERHHTAWGAAINFDGSDSRVVRDFFIHNALYWLDEYHFDGLRFDAVHAIVDDSTPHILTELAKTIRAGPARDRHIHLVLENDRNEARHLVWDDGQPRAYNAQWDDDAHHAMHVLLTGEDDGYYVDYAGDPTRQLARALAEGFAFQGDPSKLRNGELRGEPSAALPPAAFVTFLQNHDQIGNRALGERLVLLAQPQRLRAATAALLLSPAPPMLFMGEEFAAASPFLFFCDFGPELAQAVTDGRRKEFRRFAQFAENEDLIPDPNHPDSFERSKLDWLTLTRPAHAEWLALYRKLLALRRERIAPRLTRMRGHAGHATRLAHGALLATWTLGDGSTLALRLNLSEARVETGSTPQGTLLHCEPAEVAAEIARGVLPADTAAVHLTDA